MSHMDYGFYFFEGKKLSVSLSLCIFFFFFVTTACWLVPSHHRKRLTGSVPNTSLSTQPLPEIPQPQAKIITTHHLLPPCTPHTPALSISHPMPFVLCFLKAAVTICSP